MSDSRVELRYSDDWNDERSLILRKDSDRIILHHRRTERIDLSQAAELKNLNFIVLCENRLKTINLQPLSNCRHLRYLDLSRNDLSSIDLYPLLHCRKLEQLNLSGNPLDDLDTLPLHFCLNLERLMLPGLYDHHEHAPLIPEKKIFLEGMIIAVLNFHRSRGIPHWAYIRNPKPPRFERVLETLGRDGVRRLVIKASNATDQKNHYALANELIEAIGMGELAAYDGNPANIAMLTPKEEMTIEEERHSIYMGLNRLIEKPLKNGGSTLFLEVDRLAATPASVLIPLILRRREEVIQKTVLYIRGDRISLRPLWMTVYGF